MSNIMEGRERKSIQTVRDDLSHHQLTAGIKAAFEAQDKMPVSQMEWTISHPQVQKTKTIPYEYHDYLDASGCPQLDYLREDATRATVKETIEWFQQRYGLDIKENDLNALKEMLRRDFVRTVNSMRSLPAKGEVQQTRITELLQELAKMHMLAGQLGCIHCERPGHTQQQCPVLSAFAAKAKSSKEIAFRKIYKVCKDQISAEKKANEMAEKSAARFDTILQDQILDHPEDNTIMQAVARDLPVVNNMAQSRAGLAAGHGMAQPNAGQGMAQPNAGPAAGANVDANQNSSVALDHPARIDEGFGGVQNNDGPKTWESGDDEVNNFDQHFDGQNNKEKFAQRSDNKYYWADLLNRMMINLNAGGHSVQGNTKALIDFMDTNFLMFTPRSISPSEANSTRNIEPEDFYSIPMRAATQQADVFLNDYGQVISLGKVEFADFDQAVRWVQNYHQPGIFTAALRQFQLENDELYTELRDQHTKLTTFSLTSTDMPNGQMKIGPDYDCSLMNPNEMITWRAMFILGDLHYRDLLWSQQWAKIDKEVETNCEFIGFCVWKALQGAFCLYTVPYWAFCETVSQNPVVCWDDMRAQSSSKFLVAHMHIFDQIGATACQSYETLGEFIWCFPKTKEFFTAAGSGEKCLCGCGIVVGDETEGMMIVLPCYCVVPVTCAKTMYTKAAQAKTRRGFALCPISEAHQEYNQVLLGLIRMLDFKTKLCGNRFPLGNQQADDGMPTQPSNFSLKQTQTDVDGIHEKVVPTTALKDLWTNDDTGACKVLGTNYSETITAASELGPKFQTFGKMVLNNLSQQ